MNIDDLIVEINNAFLSGGGRTKAANVRSAISNVLNSYINIDTGGLAQNVLVGYATELTPEDPRHWAPKKYIDDLTDALYDAIIIYVDDNFHKKSEDLFLDDKAIIMKSFGDEEHYFKYRPDDSGNLILIEDLGTSYP